MLCEHGLLLIDPMAAEDFRDDAICVVEEKNWPLLAERLAQNHYWCEFSYVLKIVALLQIRRLRGDHPGRK